MRRSRAAAVELDDVGDVSPQRLGGLLALVSFAVAGLLGLAAVVLADDAVTALGKGVGSAALVFTGGGTIVVALACLARDRLALLALAGVVAAGATVDLTAFALWEEPESESYGKLVLVLGTWAFLLLLVLGLALAVADPVGIAELLVYAVAAAAVLAGLVATYLITTGGGGSDSAFENPLDALGADDEGLLRLLGVSFVVLAAAWFGAVAAHRLARAA